MAQPKFKYKIGSLVYSELIKLHSSIYPEAGSNSVFKVTRYSKIQVLNTFRKRTNRKYSHFYHLSFLNGREINVSFEKSYFERESRQATEVDVLLFTKGEK